MGIMGPVDSSYESEHTKFMRELMEKNPQWAKEQRSGRELWWDKPQTVEQTKQNAESNVPNKAYPYDVNFF